MLFGGCLLTASVAGADPDDPPAVQDESGDGTRRALDGFLRVLRARPDAAGRACLDAMASLRQTEQQVKDEIRHRKRPASEDSDPVPDPDLDVARDVLASDNETAARACGADAARACAPPRLPDLAQACAAVDAGTTPAR